MNRLTRRQALIAALTMSCFSLGLVPLDADAGRGGHARASVHRSGHANINRNTNIKRNTNVNRNTNINRNVNVNVNRHVDVDVNRRWNHPVGTAIAVGATAAVIGSIVYSLPSSCTIVDYGGVSYQRCGSSWYQPRYAGTSVQYVVVNPPY